MAHELRTKELKIYVYGPINLQRYLPVAILIEIAIFLFVAVIDTRHGT